MQYTVIKNGKEFDCGDIAITTEMWYGFLKQEKAKLYIDDLVTFLRQPDHKSSCYLVGQKFCKDPQHFNACVYRGLGSGLIRARKDGAKIEFRNDEVTNQFITTIWRPQFAEKGVSLLEKGTSLDEKSASLTQKGLSEDKKGLSNGEKGLSNDKKGLSLPEKGLSKKEEQILRLLEFCKTPRSMTEISHFLGMTNKTKLRNNYIYPLLDKNLAMTLPESPKSPTQKYYTINR